jgi:hypothetical protein
MKTRTCHEVARKKDPGRTTGRSGDEGIAKRPGKGKAPSRVHLITGPAGSGKTLLTHHIEDTLGVDADFQLHSATSWVPQALDLAAGILRSASIPGRDDVLLTLESEADRLVRPCLIIVDGITSQEQFDEIARHVDTSW